MVRRRSTVRFRNRAPAQRCFSNIRFQDQVTNQVMRLQLTAAAARRIRTPVPLWLAAIRLNATASDETASIVGRRPGFGRCPSPLRGDWLRFPRPCPRSRLIELVLISENKQGLADFFMMTPWLYVPGNAPRRRLWQDAGGARLRWRSTYGKWWR